MAGFHNQPPERPPPPRAGGYLASFLRQARSL